MNDLALSRRNLLVSILNVTNNRSRDNKVDAPVYVPPNVSKSEYVSRSKTFKLTTFVKDDDHTVGENSNRMVRSDNKRCSTRK